MQRRRCGTPWKRAIMEGRTDHTIVLIGCDDETIMHVRLTAEEAQIVAQIAELSRATSQYRCMPTMTLTPGIPNPEGRCHGSS